MNCRDCNLKLSAPFKLPNDAGVICPPCLHKRYIQLVKDYNDLLLEFIDFAIKKQEFIKEILNELYEV